jgi:hypothetical protein
MESYIERRIRARPPAGCGVVPHTPPIVSFGNFQKARIASLGLNPSHREFSHGYVKMGFGNLETASPSTIRSIIEDQYSYFRRQQYRWFRKFGMIVDACGASYKDGSAASLDIVQWATQPVWGGLTVRQKRKLLESDVPFLAQQLRNEKIEALLINGRGVMEALRQFMGLELRQSEIIKGVPGTPNIPDTRLYTGSLFGRIRVVAWNVNLQGTPGMNDAASRLIGARVSVLL